MSSSSSPTSPTAPQPKLPKFIRPQPQPRDRSRSTASYVDVPGSSTMPQANNGAATGGGGARTGKLGRALTKKRSKLFGRRGSDSESLSKASSSSDKERELTTTATAPAAFGASSSAPAAPTSSSGFIPRGRNSMQSSRPPSSFDASLPNPSNAVLPSNASMISTSTALHHRLSDIPGRLTGWLGAHFTPPSPTPPSQSPSSSTASASYPQIHTIHSQPQPQPQLQPPPPQPSTSAPVTQMRHSGFLKGSASKAPGPFERAFRYILDSDATPDRSEAPIWLLGVQYPGWESDRTASASPVSPTPRTPPREPLPLNNNSNATPMPSGSVYPPAAPPPPPWPPSFHASFSSLLYLTYRSHFKPIPPSHLPLPPPIPQPLPPPVPSSRSHSHSHSPSLSPSPSPTPAALPPPESPSRKWLAWVPGARELTSDTGWGCMLRTGQMLLANALLALLLPPFPPPPTYAAQVSPSLPPPQEGDRRRHEMYVRVVTWFLDDPSPLCPFSVHRLALAGAEMGREVGHWFGPSIAAGSIRTLANAFPSCGLGVVVPPDGVIHETAVFAASHTPSLPSAHNKSKSKEKEKEEWGDRAVLVLIGLRLGIEGVNPIYYDNVKALFTFPQTVGIAGGRPSSSYYFVGTQADSLFYLDPHHTRPAVPLRPPVAPLPDAALSPDPMQLTPSEMRTFHCDKVRKMHISGLDPSMLCGFLVKGREEWADLRARVEELSKGKSPIFSIADAPAAWEIDDLSDVGMESIASNSPSPEPEPSSPDYQTARTSISAPEADDDAMDVENDNENENEDDDWEKTTYTPGLASAATMSMSMMAPVPFPADPNPSPRIPPQPPQPPSRSISQATVRTDRPPARPPLGKGSNSSEFSEMSGRSGQSERSVAGGWKDVKLPALPPETFRERVDALSSPTGEAGVSRQRTRSPVRNSHSHSHSSGGGVTSPSAAAGPPPSFPGEEVRMLRSTSKRKVVPRDKGEKG